MNTQKKSAKSSTRKFNPKKSIKRAKSSKIRGSQWHLRVAEKEYVWKSGIERVNLIRKGLPYESIEVIGKKAKISVTQLLQLFSLPQTTYNKKKRDNSLLNSRDSEVILALVEVLDFGLSVFNNESEKFQRWLKKPNLSLGEITPVSLFDSIAGIQEVRNSLNRLEYGNMA